MKNDMTIFRFWNEEGSCIVTQRQRGVYHHEIGSQLDNPTFIVRLPWWYASLNIQHLEFWWWWKFSYNCEDALLQNDYFEEHHSVDVNHKGHQVDQAPTAANLFIWFQGNKCQEVQEILHLWFSSCGSQLPTLFYCKIYMDPTSMATWAKPQSRYPQLLATDLVQILSFNVVAGDWRGILETREIYIES